jgi:hypothetical protein
MNFLEGLVLDTWWKAVFWLGVIADAASVIFPIDFINKKYLFGLGLSMIMIGISYWKSQKTISAFKPPNAYTGGAGVLSWKEIRHDPFTVILLSLGIIFLVIFGLLLIKSLL